MSPPPGRKPPVSSGGQVRQAQPQVRPDQHRGPERHVGAAVRTPGHEQKPGDQSADDESRQHPERRDGVDISAIATIEDRPTGSAFVRYRENGARDFVFNIAHSAARETRMTVEAKALIEQAGHVHVMGSAFAIAGIGEIILEAIKSVKARGGSVSFDPNIRKELVQGNEGRHDDATEVTAILRVIRLHQGAAVEPT